VFGFLAILAILAILAMRFSQPAGEPLGTQKRMSRMKISIPFGFL